MKHKHKVTIIQRILPHYRITFFERLYKTLNERNIDFQLIYGQEYLGTVPKTFELDRPWAHRINNKYIRISGNELVWQPCTKMLNNSDLIIIGQSNQLLLNYLLVLHLMARKSRLAYWGHGKNMQAGDKKRFSERIKKWTTTRVDWWFAYTQLSGDLVANIGFPTDRITAVQNSIDTKDLTDAIKDTDDVKVSALKQQLGISGDNVCIYCGGMYPEKQLDFLIDACHKIKESIPDFHMLFIGSGPEQSKVESVADEFSWIKYLGPVYGKDLAPYLAMSKASLMPGPVGLVVIDSFVTGTPLLTTDNSVHGPEVEYLEDHVNGIMTTNSVHAFATAAIEYLQSSDLQTTLKHGCSISAQEFTLDNMVDNFAEGIEKSLSV